MTIERYQEKFNKLDAEIKNQKLIDRKHKCIVDQNIFENIEQKYCNFKIARRIEQSLQTNRHAIRNLDQLQIDADIDNDDYSICGYIDDQQIVHFTVTKTVDFGMSHSYVHQLSSDTSLNIEGDFSIYIEKTIDAHESQLEQAITKAIDALQHDYSNLN